MLRAERRLLSQVFGPRLFNLPSASQGGSGKHISMERLGGMILSGGASSRMGADKGLVTWLGRRAVDRVAEVAAQASCERVITVGSLDYGLPFVVEDPPFGGPVGGVLAGAAVLKQYGCVRALVLAVDAPTIRPSDLLSLTQIGAPGAVFEGFPLPLLVALDALPPDALADWPMRRLVERAGLRVITCPAEARQRVRGANTPDEQQRLLHELSEYEVTGSGDTPAND
jgi:molybdopterin-guanine dinucleotide biosynthesis protein A